MLPILNRGGTCLNICPPHPKEKKLAQILCSGFVLFSPKFIISECIDNSRFDIICKILRGQNLSVIIHYSFPKAGLGFFRNISYV